LFGHHLSIWHSTKLFPSIFDLGPLTPKIYSPKLGTKSPISRLVWQINRRCLGLPGGFRGWPIQWNHIKCSGADPCCHGNDICTRRGVSHTGLFTQPPMRRMRICLTDVCFFLFFFVFFRLPQNMRQPLSGTAERIFMKLSPNDSGENGVSNVYRNGG